jgi:triacylglycerol lipase
LCSVARWLALGHSFAMRPVVLVHGIWDSARRIRPLSRGLERRGIGPLHAIDLRPPWGNARLEVLTDQLGDFIDQVRAEHGVPAVDLVGYSMGALVSRAYLALGGHPHVRTFVSLSGPHHGSWMAYALPLAGVKQMRPNSDFIFGLGDVSSLGGLPVHCIYTPFDATVVPGKSGILRGAHSVHSIPVLLHRWMLSDARVLDLIARILRDAQDLCAD